MRLLKWLDQLAVLMAVLALIVLAGLITVSVIGRYFFSAPVPDDLVISEILLVFVAFLPLSYVQARREHVFVTVFTDWLSNSTRVALEAVGMVLSTAIVCAIAAAVSGDFYGAWVNGSYNEGPLELPEWPGRLVVAVGLWLFAIRLFVDSIFALVGLYTGSAIASMGEVEQMLRNDDK